MRQHEPSHGMVFDFGQVLVMALARAVAGGSNPPPPDL
jgi:hypothetical protein